MGLFAWMITGHFVGDFLLQTNWMASNNTKNAIALLVHSGIYTVSVSLVALLSGGLSRYAILLLFVSHTVLDQRSFVLWWCKHVSKSSEIPWLLVAADQSWHIVFLAAACTLA